MSGRMSRAIFARPCHRLRVSRRTLAARQLLDAIHQHSLNGCRGVRGKRGNNGGEVRHVALRSG